MPPGALRGRDYASTFDRRGASYDRAMTTLPDVRREEFEALVTRSALRPGLRVVDVPSGGGYLQRNLPEGVSCLHLETSPVFHAAALFAGREARLATSLGDLPLATGSVDRVLSLAGLHHESDRLRFYREAARVLRARGRLLVAEVPKGSKVAAFLDGFVDENGEGHRGSYLDEGDADLIREAGFAVDALEVVETPWRATSAAELGWFCRELFAIERATLEEVVRELRDVVGVRSSGAGVELNWELAFFSCSVNPC